MQSTIGIDFVSKNISIGERMMRLQLWDTAGQERFRSLIPNYVRDCEVAIITFDLTNEESFTGIYNWIDFIKEHREEKAVIVAVGNKLDLKEERKVNHDSAKAKFADLGILYFEVSAKTGENV
jgi:Ras-related protein Rab-6A